MDNTHHPKDNSINFPLETFLKENQDKKIGLAIGHGNIHDQQILSNIKDIDAWYLMDINKYTYPDYICDVTNNKDLNYFPNNTFDCILFAHIPVGLIHNKYFATLNNLRRILKIGGNIITTEFPLLFFWLLSNKQLVTLSNKIRKCIKSHKYHRFNLAKFLRTFDYEQVDGLKMNIQKYLILKCFCDVYHKRFITRVEYDTTRSIFRDNGYFVTKKQKKYLYWCFTQAQYQSVKAPIPYISNSTNNN